MLRPLDAGPLLRSTYLQLTPRVCAWGTAVGQVTFGKHTTCGCARGRVGGCLVSVVRMPGRAGFPESKAYLGVFEPPSTTIVSTKRQIERPRPMHSWPRPAADVLAARNSRCNACQVRQLMRQKTYSANMLGRTLPPAPENHSGLSNGGALCSRPRVVRIAPKRIGPGGVG